jgi:hypothetical protein
MAKKKRTAREALVEALKRNGGPMQAKDVVAAATKLATGLVSDKTRKGTLYGTMREEALKEDGLIVKVDTGVYQLRATLEASEETPAPAVEPEVEVAPEVQPDPKPQARRRNSRQPKATAAA